MNELLSASAITTPVPTAASESEAGIAGLTADDFMTLLIAQLQNQDPSAPVSNETLLDQVATMRALQADLELESTLESSAGTADLATAAAFLGKTVRGFAGAVEVTGEATRAYLADGVAYVEVGGEALPLSDVEEVA